MHKQQKLGGGGGAAGENCLILFNDRLAAIKSLKCNQLNCSYCSYGNGDLGSGRREFRIHAISLTVLVSFSSLRNSDSLKQAAECLGFSILNVLKHQDVASSWLNMASY